MILRWLRSNWEVRLVFLTLLALLASVFSESAAAPEPMMMLFNLTAYAAGGYFGSRAALQQLRDGKIDIDLLMLLAAIGAASIGEWHEGAILLFLFSLSNALQDYVIQRNRTAIHALYQMYPEECTVVRAGQSQLIRIHEVNIGDRILIRPGERIPVDGRIVAGTSALDESTLTGESLPVDKGPDDPIFAGTLNTQGALEIQAEQRASDSTLARVIQLVEEAQEGKAPTQRLIERFSSRYSTTVLIFVFAWIIFPPLLWDVDFRSNFYQAMVLLIVACPCALVISTPAAYLSAIAGAARRGLLFKGGAFLESLALVRAVAFDKTGTLTQGQPVVTDVHSAAGITQPELLQLAARIESRSEHPLAKAFLRAAYAENLLLHENEELHDFYNEPGLGIRASIGDHSYRIGRVSYLAEELPLPECLNETYDSLSSAGRTIVGVMKIKPTHCWLGLIAFADPLREEAASVVTALHERGVHVAMFTGDHDSVAQRIARPLGIKDVHAGLLPDEKVDRLHRLAERQGATAMIGEGVNDAPALAHAPVGIALGGASSDIALDSADIILMGNRLSLIIDALEISRRARRVVMQNIVFSLTGIALLIAGVFLIDLPLPIGVLGHEGSTVIVTLNGLISLLVLPEIQRKHQQATRSARL